MNNESQLTMNNIEESQTYISQESVSEVIPTAGSMLESARKAQNWSVMQVSDQLKLSQAQILALEANQYHLLPTLVIVRGFVRAYAKLLKLDPSPLIALLPKDHTPKPLDDSLKPALSTPFIDSKLNLIGRSETNRLYIIGAFVLVVLVGLFLISQNSYVKGLFGNQFATSQQKVLVKNDAHTINLELASAGQKSDVIVHDEMQITPNKKVDEAVVSSESQKNTVSDVVTPNAAAVVPLPVVEKKVEATVPTNTVINTVINANTSVGTSTNKNSFVLKFRENSWIQIKTEKGVILAERLVKAGAEETFEVNQTLLVRIGNVAGVDAILRGEVFKFSPVGGSNVVNLSIK